MTPDPKQTVLLLDMSSLVHPLFHVSGSEPDPNWTSNKALQVARGLASKYPFMAVCLDKGRSFRKDIDPQYKANRGEKDGALIHQLRLTEDALKADGFPMWGQPGYEADDVIATATRIAVEKGVPVVVASSDKDLLQLVNDAAGVSAYSLSKDKLFTEKEVLEAFGVRADQIGDYLAMVGDSSDNIKGVPQVGPKSAVKLLAEYGNIAAILKEPGRMKEAMKVALFVNKPIEPPATKDGLSLARELVALRTDAAIDFDVVFQDRVSDNSKTEDSMSDDLTPAVPVAAPAPAVPVAAPVAEAAVAAPVTDVVPVEVPAVTPVVPKSAPDVIVGRGDTSLVPFNRQLEPTNLTDARTIAKWAFESKLFSAYGSPQAVFAVIASGRELGLSTMASLRAFHVVEGKTVMSADFVRALVLNSGKAECFRCTERTPTKATFLSKRVGQPEMSLSYTIEEATTAGLVKPGSGWAKHPTDMLAKTASTKLARLEYPDLTMGLYCGAEMGGDE